MSIHIMKLMNSEIIQIENLVNEKKKKLAICNILNFNGSWSLESVKVNFNLIQRRKWMKYETLAIYNTVSVILVCCLGLLFFFFSADCLFVWLGCGTSCIPFPILFLCSHSRGKIYILYTQFPHMQNSHMQNYISYAKLAYVRNLRKVFICKAILIYRSQSLVWLSNASILMCTFVMNYIL